MEVSVEVDKIIKRVMYNTVFFPLGRGVDDVLGRLLLNRLSRMSVWCAFHSVSNIHGYFGNCEWIRRICPELFPVSIHNPFNPQLVVKT